MMVTQTDSQISSETIMPDALTYGAHERLDIVLSEFCPDGKYRCGTSGVYVWAKLTLLLINM
jgi:hypothetical protein